MKKRVIAIWMSMMMLAGCGSNVDSVKKVDPLDPPVSSTEGEPTTKKEQEEQSFHIGERAVFDDRYALTILSMTETSDRNEFSEKEVAQVFFIEYLYENLDSEEEIYISEMDFKMVDAGGNMVDTYPLDAGHSAQYTPKGAKTLGSFAVGTVVEGTELKLHYYDNFFASTHDCIFILQEGESVLPNLSGTLPTFDNTFGLGEVIEVSTSEGDYRLTIEGVKRTEERNSFETRTPEVVYEIKYSYENISVADGLYISEYSFTLIDGQGNTGYTYPNFSDTYPQETLQGTKSSGVMFFAAHKESERILLTFKDNFFTTTSDIYIEMTP